MFSQILARNNAAVPVADRRLRLTRAVIETRCASARLASASQHRGPKVPDLLIAAIAEQHGLIVLHVDRDFDIIAKVTGQRVERLLVD